MEQSFVKKTLLKATGNSIVGIENLPRDLKRRILAFLELEEASLYSMSKVSRSWNILVLELLKTQVENLSQEEFNKRFAYSVFKNNVRDFNLFKKILENKGTSLRPKFYWMLKEQEIEDYSKDDKGKQRIEKYEDDDDMYFGMSMLYAAIQRHANPDMAIYLIQKMKETEKEVECEEYTEVNEETEKELTSWACQWPNLGYANGANITPLTMAVLNALDWEKKGYSTEKKNKFEELSKLLISHGGTIQTSAYHENIFEKSCWLPRKALFIALEKEKALIKTMYQEALQKMQKTLEEKDTTLFELQAENKKLKEEIESFNQFRRKNLFPDDRKGKDENESPSKKSKFYHGFFPLVGSSQSRNSIIQEEETMTSSTQGNNLKQEIETFNQSVRKNLFPVDSSQGKNKNEPPSKKSKFSHSDSFLPPVGSSQSGNSITQKEETLTSSIQGNNVS